MNLLFLFILGIVTLDVKSWFIANYLIMVYTHILVHLKKDKVS
jgi:hypothetical protein